MCESSLIYLVGVTLPGPDLQLLSTQERLLWLYILKRAPFCHYKYRQELGGSNSKLDAVLRQVRLLRLHLKSTSSKETFAGDFNRREVRFEDT